MTACLTEQQFVRFIDGQLAADEARGVMGHVDACPACLSVLVLIARKEPSLTGAGPSVGPLPGAWEATRVAPAGDAEARPRIGAYSIVRLLGGGGMGLVFEAMHEQIGRRVAIKVLHADLARDPEMAVRFLNEARAANLISHPGIVGISEFGQTPEGAPYLVMELLPGESLRERLRRQGRLGPEALRVARQIASALVAAHQTGIVHRDLKPDNVMLVPDPELPERERAKILDFGLAKLAEALQADGFASPRTRSGLLLGTPAYMAPEQCRGAPAVDGKADVYALGVMLHEMLAGRPPFVGTPGELIAMHQYASPPPVGEGSAAIGSELAGLIERMMAKAPDERPGMTEVADELERLGGFWSGARPKEVVARRSRLLWIRRRVLLPVAAALLLAAVLLGWRTAARWSAVKAARVDPAVVRPVHTPQGHAEPAPSLPPVQSRARPARPAPRAPVQPKVNKNEDVEFLPLEK